MNSRHPARDRGFTLVELSIVLVILGLLIGGVTVGRNLIRASELRSVTADIDKYRIAVAAFQEKYGALPGDFSDATGFWGVAHADPVTCVTTVGTGTQTCNGDANGSVDATIGDYYETFRFWQHLSNAGLVEGSFTGVSDPSGSYVTRIGVNVPASRIGGAGYSAAFFENPFSPANYFSTEYGHIFFFGAQYPNATTSKGVILPDEAYGIDVKVDDGRPGSGIVLGLPSSSFLAPNCTTSSDAATAAYALSTINPCSLIFRLGY